MDEQDIKLIEKDPKGDIRSHWSILLLTRLVLPIAILGVGLGAAKHLIDTSPKPPHRPAQKQAAIVEVFPVQFEEETITVQAMGTVIPAQEVQIQPQVSGEIIEVNSRLIPGGRLESGETMLKIDPRDYDLIVQQNQANVVQAEYEIKVEMGYQEIAKREWELLGDQQEKATDLDIELALRKPHLLKAQANLRSAKAALEQAQLDLERTVIKAPFNGMIIEESIDKGAQITQQSQLATFVGTDVYWVQASVPMDRLHWIQFPNSHNNYTGSPVRIYTSVGNEDHEWSGTVLRLMGDLETKGRMARVLVEVRDPLGLKTKTVKTPLLIGAYVNLDFQGGQAHHVAKIDRKYSRDNNTIWIMTPDNKLEIRSIKPTYKTHDAIYIAEGLESGEHLIVSDLPAPVQGMDLITRDEYREKQKNKTAPMEKPPASPNKDQH